MWTQPPVKSRPWSKDGSHPRAALIAIRLQEEFPVEAPYFWYVGFEKVQRRWWRKKQPPKEGTQIVVWLGREIVFLNLHVQWPVLWDDATEVLTATEMLKVLGSEVSLRQAVNPAARNVLATHTNRIRLEELINAEER